MPPVQFNSCDGETQIVQPNLAVRQHENPETIQDGLQNGFVNQGRHKSYFVFMSFVKNQTKHEGYSNTLYNNKISFGEVLYRYISVIIT